MADINLPSVQTSANPLAALLEAAGAFFTTFTQAKMQKQQMEAQRAHEMALAETRGRFNVEAAKAQQGTDDADPIRDALQFRYQQALAAGDAELGQQAWTELMAYNLDPSGTKAALKSLYFGGVPADEVTDEQIAEGVGGLRGAGQAVGRFPAAAIGGAGRFISGMGEGIMQSLGFDVGGPGSATTAPPAEATDNRGLRLDPSALPNRSITGGRYPVMLEAVEVGGPALTRPEQAPIQATPILRALEDRKKKVVSLDAHIDATAKKYGVSPAVVRAMIQAESAGVAGAVSPKGALGLMQLMPDTAAELGVDRTDPYQNIEGGTRYFSQQLKRFGDVDKALAAYNFGPDNVASGEPWPKETRKFVKKVKRLAGLEESR